MAKTIIIFGYGPGISAAVAEKFGKEGFAVAAVARNPDKLGEGVKALEAKGIKATAIPGDVGDPEAIKAIVAKAKGLGPISAIHWNAYSGEAGDLLAVPAIDVRKALDVGVIGLLAAIQETLPDLKKDKGAVLVTNGGLGYYGEGVDGYALATKSAGLSIANAAKHKMVGILTQQLAADGVFVGEVVVLASVKGSAWDDGSATIEASGVAAKFWELHTERKSHSFDYK